MGWNDKNEYSAVVYGKVPSKSNNYKMGKGSFYKADSVKTYEEAFALQAGRLKDVGIDYPFEFHINVWFANKASDLDGCFKVIFDTLQDMNTITNDKLCVHINARKFIDKKQPRIEFTIKKAA